MQSPAKYRTMAAMPKRLRRLLTALVLGAIATLLLTFLPMTLVDRGHGAQIRQVYRGEFGWFHARDHAFGLEWSNLQLMQTTLSTPLFDGELPGWAEPPAPPYPKVEWFRVGTLATGWPLRTIAYRWTVSSMTRLFPMAAELDDQDTSIVYAAESVLTGSRGGGPDERQVLWVGVGANVVIFTVVLLGLLTLAGRVRGLGAGNRVGQNAPMERHSAGKSGSNTSTKM